MRPMVINAPAVNWNEVSAIEARNTRGAMLRHARRHALPVKSSIWARMSAWLSCEAF